MLSLSNIDISAIQRGILIVVFSYLKSAVGWHNPSQHAWAYGKEKIRGRKEICPPFSDCARVSKIVVDGGGGSDNEKVLLGADYMEHFQPRV